MKRLIFATTLLVSPFAGRALADNHDSDADADGGFHNTVATSAAVMIRVPVDTRGVENSTGAEMRLITTRGAADAPTDATAAWGSGTDVSRQPTVDPQVAGRDTSTHGWYGWNNWYGNYGSYGYYNSYRPSYYYYNAYSSYYPNYYAYYSYGSPYSYYNYGNYGYNYYYYPYYGTGYYPCR